MKLITKASLSPLLVVRVVLRKGIQSGEWMHLMAKSFREYQTPEDGIVVMKLYDVLGREVKALVNESQKADDYSATLDASQLASGVYLYRLTAGSFVSVKKLLLLR
jgi:hypothetical protein